MSARARSGLPVRRRARAGPPATPAALRPPAPARAGVGALGAARARRHRRAGRAAAARRPGRGDPAGHHDRAPSTGSRWPSPVFVVVQAVLIRFATLASARLGERVLAELREDFVDRVLAIPLSTVERAGTGDLLTRTSRDVDALSHSVRFAVPETLIALVTGVFAVGALLLVGAAARAAAACSRVPVLWAGTRWYLRRAPDGLPARERRLLGHHRRHRRDGRGRAHGRGAAACGRRRRPHRRRHRAGRTAAERYTLFLRTVWFPIVEIGYVLPVVADAGRRRLVLHRGLGDAGPGHRGHALRAAAHRPARPAAVLAGRAAGRRRLAGPAARRRRRCPTTGAAGARARPARSSRLAAAGRPLLLRGRPRRAARRRPDASRRASGWPMVGPSGAGKSTLGRLLAGIHAPAHRLGHGRRRAAGRAAAGRAARARRAGHPGAPRLRRHAARQPGAGPPRRRPTPRSAAALAAVDALDWVDGPAGRPGHGGRLGRARGLAGAGPAARAGPAGPGRPAHAGARRGHLADRPAGGPAPGAVAGGGAATAAR